MTKLKDKEPPKIPPRVSSLMPKARRDALEKKARSVSHASQASTKSQDSTISEFLENEVVSASCELDYIHCAQEGLLEVLKEKKITGTNYVDELKPFLERFEEANSRLTIVKANRRTLMEDLEDEIATKRRKGGQLDTDFLERAYTDAIVPRVMAATAKQRKQHFDQSRFRKDVAEFYGFPGRGYCHLTGYWDTKTVKAAHIVPKSLSGRELAHLFGVTELMLADPRNAISLHKNIESGLDNGTIVIIPFPSEMNESPKRPTRWRCVLTDESLRHQTVFETPRDTRNWGDLDQEELRFLNDNRPARRYLYFRFIITYIYRKRMGESSFTRTVEKRKDFWPSPGEYLERSTLVTLARNISGFELPAALLDDKTFDVESQETYATRSNRDNVATIRVYNACIASYQADDDEAHATDESDVTTDSEADDYDVAYD